MDKIKREVIIFAVFVALGYGVYQYFRPYNPSPQKLTSSQQEAINKINAEMKPYCVGRYMLDLPSSFRAEESPEKKTGIEFYDLLIFAKKFNEITLCLSVKYARLFSVTL
ncbi:hypothetical protein ABRP70_08275 [Pectobacterium odoriferum]|uniref:Tle cognate immunity protein 4 N-terminal domain-containing protein n=1 Tax=Pectobacterium odoriferum TaxID=78398 RepID=A0ABR4VI80_9GAMM|nr:hypothetical protein [Pectobacterium odoriferum]KGA26281.1 hypothetical protein KS43_23045 [Pectobacterium odoriferum]KGA39036.1 hypothetical protein KU75_25110 [Pectobacterium odoriferum]MBA0190742.1 hypothetical protein [Pectobacterium odoriferum]